MSGYTCRMRNAALPHLSKKIWKETEGAGKGWVEAPQLSCVDSSSERAPPSARKARLTTGDSVYIVDGDAHRGEQGTIVQDDGPGDSVPYKVRFCDGDTTWFSAKNVAAVTQSSSSTFTVGQRVECKDNGDSGWKPGKITQLSPLKVHVDGYSDPFSWDQVRALPQLGRPTKGAVVRIGSGNNRAGELGLIIQDDRDSKPFKVRFRDGGTKWFSESEVRWCSASDMRAGSKADQEGGGRSGNSRWRGCTLCWRSRDQHSHGVRRKCCSNGIGQCRH